MKQMTQVSLLRLIALCLPMMFLAGCHGQAHHLSTPASGLFAPVPAGVQTQTEQVSQQFLQALHQKRYAEAERLMTPRYRAADPPTSLRDQSETIDRPLQSASGFQYTSAEWAMHQHQVVLRAQFLSGDGKIFHTNIILAGSGNHWRIDMLVPPVAHRAPRQNRGESSAAS
jgi:hypothetical protein